MTVDASTEARAARLSLARAKRHATAADAARALGMNPVTVRAHENAQNGYPIEDAVTYASAYGVSLSWLLTGEEEAPARLAGALDTSSRAALAASLKAELAKPGRSQSELARRLGVDSSAINRACAGERELSALELAQAEAYLEETVDAPPSTLASRIAERLAATGKTARGASLEAGLGPDAVRTILDGRSKSPRAENLGALAKVLGCDLARLIDGDGDGDAALPPDPADALAERLRRRIKAAGLNNYSAARKAGLGDDFVRDILRGKVRDPGALGLAQLAQALGCTMGELVGDPAAAPSEPGSLSIADGAVRLTLSRVVSLATAAQVLALIAADEGA